MDIVTRLDASGVALVGYRLGIELTCLNHEFTSPKWRHPVLSTLTIGVAVPWVGAVLDRFIHKFLFNEAMSRAWLRTVEEVGPSEREHRPAHLSQASRLLAPSLCGRKAETSDLSEHLIPKSTSACG
ncbi:MAG: hypothetical protein K2Y71_15555 [Xanthobacteraceae bacterium]|nr:hypothetical protein [Xanthobacteraceae bacterium]